MEIDEEKWKKKKIDKNTRKEEKSVKDDKRTRNQNRISCEANDKYSSWHSENERV